MQKVKQWYNNGDRSQLQDFMVSNRMWMPMKLFSGIMNIMFFTSMMSMMGMAMNPMESQKAGGKGANTGSTLKAMNVIAKKELVMLERVEVRVM